MAPHELAEAIKSTPKDGERFRPLYDAHVDALLARVAQRVYDVEIALDIVAESFAQAYVGARRFRGNTDAEATAWLFGIAAKQLAMYFRRHRVETKALRRLGLEPPSLDDEDLRRVIELADLDELRSAVRRELARLSPEQRGAVELRIVQELDYPQVASKLGVSEDAARARVSRGLRSLSRTLGQHHTAQEV